jgi:hypothetical protein
MLLGLGVKSRSAPEIVEELELEEFAEVLARFRREQPQCAVLHVIVTFAIRSHHIVVDLFVYSTVLATFRYVPSTTRRQL